MSQNLVLYYSIYSKTLAVLCAQRKNFRRHQESVQASPTERNAAAGRAGAPARTAAWGRAVWRPGLGDPLHWRDLLRFRVSVWQLLLVARHYVLQQWQKWMPRSLIARLFTLVKCSLFCCFNPLAIRAITFPR